MTLSNYLQHLPNEAVEEYNWEQAKTFLVGFVVGETFLLALFGVLVLYSLFSGQIKYYRLSAQKGRPL